VVSVRGGGHNVSGNAVSDGGLMIRTDASSRHFDLNGEARMAKSSHNSAIIPSI
jgi:FAD/FMN-containing dehydrogenase